MSIALNKKSFAEFFYSCAISLSFEITEPIILQSLLLCFCIRGSEENVRKNRYPKQYHQYITQKAIVKKERIL